MQENSDGSPEKLTFWMRLAQNCQYFTWITYGLSYQFQQFHQPDLSHLLKLLCILSSSLKTCSTLLEKFIAYAHNAKLLSWCANGWFFSQILSKLRFHAQWQKTIMGLCPKKHIHQSFKKIPRDSETACAISNLNLVWPTILPAMKHWSSQAAIIFMG